MKFSLMKFTLSLLLAVGTQAAYWNSLPNEHNIQQREIHVPHPRLRRVYMDKVTKPDTSEKSTEENSKVVADKVTDVKDEVENDSNDKDLTKEPMQPTTTVVPEYDVNVKNEVNKDLEKETNVEEEERRKRNTYEGLNKKKANVQTIDESQVKTDYTLESKPMEEATTINSVVESITLPEKVDTDVPEALPIESNEDELENTAATRLKREMYEGMKKSPPKEYSDEELNKSKLQSTTSQPDIPVDTDNSKETDQPKKNETDKSEETDQSNKNEVEKPIENEISDDKEGKRSKRNTYEDGIKSGIKVNTDEELNKKPATPLKSEPNEKIPVIDVESTTYHGKTEGTTEQSTESENKEEEANNEEEVRRKRNTYKDMKKNEIKIVDEKELQENPETPLKSKPLEETLDTESTTSDSGYDTATDKSEDKLIEHPNESETEANEVEENRRKRNAYGYVKKTGIQVDTEEKLNEKPTTPLNSDSLEETTVTILDIDLTTSQSKMKEEQTA